MNVYVSVLSLCGKQNLYIPQIRGENQLFEYNDSDIEFYCKNVIFNNREFTTIPRISAMARTKEYLRTKGFSVDSFITMLVVNVL